jgi:hypothetical protein
MEELERRRVPRYALRIPLSFQTLRAPGSPEQASESLDISSQGVCFATDLALSVGAPVHVFLRMPTEVVGKPAREWCCRGRIVHTRPDDLFGKRDVGVQFLYYDVVESGRGCRT